jgi:hypothetical protein
MFFFSDCASCACLCRFARNLRVRLCREHLGALFRASMNSDAVELARAFKSVQWQLP